MVLSPIDLPAARKGIVRSRQAAERRRRERAAEQRFARWTALGEQLQAEEAAYASMSWWQRVIARATS